MNRHIDPPFPEAVILLTSLMTALAVGVDIEWPIEPSSVAYPVHLVPQTRIQGAVIVMTALGWALLWSPRVVEYLQSRSE